MDLPRLPSTTLWTIIVIGVAIIAASFFLQQGGEDFERTEIMPEADSITMSSEGVFDTVLINNAEQTVRLWSVTLVDEKDSKVRCSLKDDVYVTPQQSMKVHITGCGQRTPGEEYGVNVKIDYGVVYGETTNSKTQINVLRGTVA
ncbi:MAG: hypothetical protein V1744_07825 [Candidatus Altiarchaeota archaeon]